MRDKKESFLELLKKANEEEQEEAVEVGKVSEETRRDFQKHKMNARLIYEELEYRKKQLEAEVTRRIFNEFCHRLEMLDDEKDHLWELVYDELEICPHGDYKMNWDSGIVRQIIE
jgi:hypothetical protein